MNIMTKKKRRIRRKMIRGLRATIEALGRIKSLYLKNVYVLYIEGVKRSKGHLETLDHWIIMDGDNR